MHHRWLLFSLICLVAVVCTRYLAKLYRNVDLARDIPMPQESNFANATGKTDIFYFDLGGTMCMCEWKWNVYEYWSKVVSGFAFNFAHVIGTFEFYVLTGETKILVIAVFVNEMIEELWLTSGYWGFTLDPPMDMESRYDSLIRDTICCFIGIALAKKFCHIFRVKPAFKAPIINDWNPKNPHSIARFLKLVVQGVTLWQITLIYNSDPGPFHFNPTNVMLVISYTGVIAVICMWNMDDFPECSRRHIISWHVGWAAFSGLVFLFTIYPISNSAMYLIAMVESVATIALYWIEVGIRYKWRDMDKLIFGAAESNKNYNKLPESDDKLSIRCYEEAIQQLENRGVKTVSVDELEKMVVSMATKNSQQHTDHAVSLQVTVLKTLLRLFVIWIAWMEPFLWEGAQYRRHWCGNPLVKGFNGCAKYH